MKRRLSLALLLLLHAALPAAALQVFAAASLSDALKELAAAYPLSGTVQIQLNFAASSTLARQIIDGAPADLFASADEAQMLRLVEAALVQGAPRALLSNSLVAVARKDSPLKIKKPAVLADAAVVHLALADPRAVPNGVYAKQYFSQLGLWGVLEPKLITTENVLGALQAVVSGNADAAIVYRSDVLASQDLRVLFEVPKAKGPVIRYPFAVLKASAQPEEAKAFLDYLASPASRKVFLRYGFLKP